MGNIMLLAIILVQLIRQLSGQPNCKLNQAVMTCHYEIPMVIPPNVHNVFIQDFNGSLESYKFADASWKSVTYLDIESYVKSYQLPTGLFSHLVSLIGLGFHHSSGLSMHRNAFAGLDNIEVLDLSGCRHLYMHDNNLFPSFFDTFPKVKTLNLINVGNFGGRPLLFDNDFVRMINGKGIKSLMLGKQTILVNFDINTIWPSPPYDLCPLQSIYVSSVVVVMHRSMTRGRWIDLPIFDIFANFKTIHLSNMTIYPGSMESTTEQSKSYSLCRSDSGGNTLLLTVLIFFNEFVLQNVIFSTGEISGIVDAKYCIVMRLNILKLNNCGIKNINVTWTIPDDVYLGEIDFSNNEIHYFFIKGNMQSIRLVLRKNNLQKMNSVPEFSQVFVTWTRLQYLDLGWNGLLNLPRDMFSRNIQLKKLFLNDNGFTSVPITLKYLKYLQLLDLRNNLITSLDANAIVDLQKLMKVYNTTVDLKMNPFECSCKTKDFVKWISSITYHRQEYNCYMEDKSVTIGEETFRDCRFLCYRDILNAGITIICLLVVSVVILVSVKRYLMLRKLVYDNERQVFITKLLVGNIVGDINQHFDDTNDISEVQRQEFLVMLAHHNDDKSMCSDTVYDPLHNGLKSLLHTTNDLVFFDKEPPGVSIFTEMERGTLISCVFVCVLTKDVCKDRMFEFYLNNAIIENKPIVFIICERIVEVLPQMMKAMLRTTYTVEMYNEDRPPDWDTVCKDLLNLAVNANRNSDSIYSVKTCLLQTVCICPRSTFKARSEDDTCELIDM